MGSRKGANWWGSRLAPSVKRHTGRRTTRLLATSRPWFRGRITSWVSMRRIAGPTLSRISSAYDRRGGEWSALLNCRQTLGPRRFGNLVEGQSPQEVINVFFSFKKRKLKRRVLENGVDTWKHHQARIPSNRMPGGLLWRQAPASSQWRPVGKVGVLGVNFPLNSFQTEIGRAHV